MSEFRMPSLGADMEEGTLLTWRVHTGDVVHKGDIVAEVDTSKAAIEVECFDDGTMGEILVPEGATVPVGTVLATIEPNGARPAEARARAVPTAVSSTQAPESAAPERTSDEAASVAATADRSTAARRKPKRRQRSRPAATATVPRIPEADVHATPLIRRLAEEAGIDLASVNGSGSGGRILRADVEHAVAARRGMVAAAPPRPGGAPLAAPGHIHASGYARRLARELGIDLSAVSGSGPGGAIRSADVRAAQPSPTTDRASVETPEVPSRVTSARPQPQSAPPRDSAAMRRTIAATMTRSKQTIPHYYLSSTIDLAAATDWLREVNKAAPVPDRIVMAALLLRAVALAARTVPAVNGHWIDDEFHPADTVDLGMIVSLRGGGILAPTIARADTMDPRTVMTQLRDVVARARQARLRSSDTVAATITVTNLGDLGVESVIGVISPPQVAIVGFGAVSERPCAVDGFLGVRPQVTVTLAADHRVSDGAVGARFLNTIAELLQHPDQL
ncbi:2-oxo acid dehydrogenase subunit E2 [Nocardia nepalensis]|uniref:2-oxo acid dehydrogenase subunit E2 n=1 Tax=Nocardia nepalensis TaxID=3375448 RepID=UPI003B672C46